MADIEVTDVRGAVRSYLTAYPGLTGAGNPLAAGVHLGRVRSPSKGAIAGVEVGRRDLSDISDDARLTFRISAVGGEQGPLELVDYAAGALIRAIVALQDGQQVVQTRRGEWVRLLIAGDVAGPTDAGDYGGEISVVVDALFRCQTATGP